MAGKGWKYVSKQEFATIKTLQSLPTLKKGQVKEITKRSDGVLNLVREAENFDDYKRLSAEQQARARARTVEVKTQVAEPSTVEQIENPIVDPKNAADLFRLITNMAETVFATDKKVDKLVRDLGNN